MGIPVKGLDKVEKISDRLRKVRAESGLSTRDFATLLSSAGYDVSHGSVSAYENEDTRVPADYIALVCKLFDKNPRWLLTGDGIEEDVPATDAERLLMQIRAMIALPPGRLKRMDPENKGDACNDR